MDGVAQLVEYPKNKSERRWFESSPLPLKKHRHLIQAEPWG